QFDGLQKSAATHVADEGMIAEPLVEAAGEIRALLAHVGQELVTPDYALHRQGSGASERMAHIGMAVSERARTLLERGEDLFLHEERPYGRIAAAQSLRYCHQVGTCSFLLAGMQRAGAPHSAHHLVEDEQDVMPIADIADTLEIARHRRNGA